MQNYTDDGRAPNVVFSADSMAVYRFAAEQGRTTGEQAGEFLRKNGHHTRFTGTEILEQLAVVGLLAPEPDNPAFFVPIDPRHVEAKLGAMWRTSALNLLEKADDLKENLAPLLDSYDRAHAGRKEQGAGILRLTGITSINYHISHALSGCRWELLTAQPGGGRGRTVLREAFDRDSAVLSRGASMRTLYQHTARHDVATRDYVQAMVHQGAQVRTLDEFFERLIIIDRETAFIPASGDRTEAVEIVDPAVVGYLADLFDRSWQRAEEFPLLHAASTTREVSSRLRQTIIRLLIEGESDPVIARRVGLSVRTLAGHIAKLKSDLGAANRIQLGYRLAKQELDAPDTLTEADTP